MFKVKKDIILDFDPSKDEVLARIKDIRNVYGFSGVSMDTEFAKRYYALENLKRFYSNLLVLANRKLFLRHIKVNTQHLLCSEVWFYFTYPDKEELVLAIKVKLGRGVTEVKSYLPLKVIKKWGNRVLVNPLLALKREGNEILVSITELPPAGKYEEFGQYNLETEFDRELEAQFGEILFNKIYKENSWQIKSGLIVDDNSIKFLYTDGKMQGIVFGHNIFDIRLPIDGGNLSNRWDLDKFFSFVRELIKQAEIVKTRSQVKGKSNSDDWLYFASGNLYVIVPFIIKGPLDYWISFQIKTSGAAKGENHDNAVFLSFYKPLSIIAVSYLNSDWNNVILFPPASWELIENFFAEIKQIGLSLTL